MPTGTQEEVKDWSTVSNCYGWACNCKKPAGVGTPVPGGKAKKPAFPGPDVKKYHQALVDGAVADGLKKIDGKPEELPKNLPTDGSWLVLLMANKVGFHWLRYDAKLDRWSWKDGNVESVKHNILRKDKYIYLKSVQDKGNLKDVFDPKTKKDFFWGYADMEFISYFTVPAKGVEVGTGK